MKIVLQAKSAAIAKTAQLRKATFLYLAIKARFQMLELHLFTAVRTSALHAELVS